MNLINKINQNVRDIANFTISLDKVKEEIDKWKNKFLEIVKLIKEKLFGKKEEREQYMEVANELYNNDIIDANQFDEMYDIYESSENYDNNHGKSDNFER